MPNQQIVEQLRRQVVDRYRVPPDEVCMVRAPYRVCPLGAHIDHQLGPVTAMVIDRAVHVAFAPSHSDEVLLTSYDFPGEVRFSLTAVPAPQQGDWGNFARGAVLALQQKYHLHTGICGVTAGRLDGGGLSSSAAIGVALLLALEHANGLEVLPRDNIDLDQAIENEYLGLRNGILDQAAILLSQRGQLTYIDCLTREYQLFRPPPDRFPFSILIVFSGLKRALTATDYNRRVEECAAAAETLLDAVGRPHDLRVLRSIAPDEYAEWKHVLQGPAARRAEHFFGEMARVEQGVAAWRGGALERFGQLISQSGRSSIENYQCGCPPLIDLYEILCGTPGVLGARFSGAGFRGCCVALTEPEAAEQAAEQVLEEYRRRQPELAEAAYTLVCQSDDGAALCE
jgi:galacturonokinase